MLYPGHKYLGPGNKLNNGTPVDNADKIAQKHDYAYDAAKTKQQIFSADRAAISEFASDFVTHPNLPSLAGFVGIGAKHTVERATNSIIYPVLGKS